MHFVINLDKPAGITSQEAVIKVKKIYKAKKAGHAGTLDPLATGVLIVCLNEATKAAGYLTGLDKEYRATLKLGERTDTYDAEGRVIERKEVPAIDDKIIRAVLDGFTGEILQTPPMYSAIKVSGTPLYRLARKGIVTERLPRKARIDRLDVAGFSPPCLDIVVSCASGTYIRSLAEDIGLALGTGAHVTALRRTRVGNFSVSDSATFDELPGKKEAVLSLDDAIGHLKEVPLEGRTLALAIHGTAVSRPAHIAPGECLRLKDDHGRLFAIGIANHDEIKVQRIFHIEDCNN